MGEGQKALFEKTRGKKPPRRAPRAVGKQVVPAVAQGMVIGPGLRQETGLPGRAKGGVALAARGRHGVENPFVEAVARKHPPHAPGFGVAREGVAKGQQGGAYGKARRNQGEKPGRQMGMGGKKNRCRQKKRGDQKRQRGRVKKAGGRKHHGMVCAMPWPRPACQAALP
ncbi:MAG: hypothetical protein AB7D37_08345 [Desulfovibrio sp.]